MDHCFRSENYVNVIVADKQNHLQFLDMESAIQHCTKGLGIWDFASNDQGSEPDVVMASCGDVITQEALAATALLRHYLPDVKIRFVNVVDVMKLQPDGYHPHGLTDKEYRAIFTDDKPIVFNFHSYPWLIHRFTYKRPGQHLMHVRGYKEKGNIDTPLELAIRNETDRFSLAILAIDIMNIGNKGASAREALKNEQIKGKNFAYETGMVCFSSFVLYHFHFTDIFTPHRIHKTGQTGSGHTRELTRQHRLKRQQWRRWQYDFKGHLFAKQARKGKS